MSADLTCLSQEHSSEVGSTLSLSKNPFRKIESPSSLVLTAQQPGPSPSTSPSEGGSSKLGSYFSSQESLRRHYADYDIQEISRLLAASKQEKWSRAPRLYIILRSIGQLQTLDNILAEGISDIWFPFTASTVPRVLSSSLRARFLDVQPVVFTKAFHLEKSELKQHAHFGRDEVFPFEIKETLGSGAFATVHKIFSPFSHREFARKRFNRGKGQGGKAEIQSFKNELQVLKRIQHHHCIELIASYTDTRSFGLIMSPVATYNLAKFFDHATKRCETRALLREFYGCLATGLCYLHDAKIRHRDIKPENILVKDRTVYLSDFGISLDWEALTRCTTTEDSGKSWIYCAPEVARCEKRNNSSDIWSLGCVFVEMCTVIKGSSVDAMRQHLKKMHESYKFYESQAGIKEWIRDLRSRTSQYSPDDFSLDWISNMLQMDPKARPSAHDLLVEISQAQTKCSKQDRFIGECCMIDSSDDDSSAQNLSDNDVWAGNLEEKSSSVTSPTITDPIAESPSLISPPPRVSPVVDNLGLHSNIQVAESLHNNRMETHGFAESPKPPDAETPLIELDATPSTASVGETEESLPHVTQNYQNSDSGFGEDVTTRPNWSFSRHLNTLALDDHLFAYPGLLPPRPPKIRVDDAGIKGSEINEDIDKSKQESFIASKDSWAVAEVVPTPESRLCEDEGLINFEIPDETLQSMAGKNLNGVDQNPSAWPQVHLYGKVPLLDSYSWSSPSSLLESVRSDLDFMDFLQVASPTCFNLTSKATISDVTSLLQMLIANGLDLNPIINEDQDSPLKGVLKWGEASRENADMDTPLLSVLAWGEAYYDLFLSMFNAGARIDFKNKAGMTPFLRACAKGIIWAIDFLVDSGITMDQQKCNIIPWGLCNGMLHASHHGKLNSMRALGGYGMNPDETASTGATPLLVACSKGHVDIVEYLLKMRYTTPINIDVICDDSSPLQWACIGGHTSIVAMLLAHGADVNGGKDLRSGKWTPLQTAASAGNIRLVRLLLEHGAKVSGRTAPIFSGAGSRYLPTFSPAHLLGTTAIAEAERKGHHEILCLLNEAKTIQERSTGSGTFKSGARMPPPYFYDTRRDVKADTKAMKPRY